MAVTPLDIFAPTGQKRKPDNDDIAEDPRSAKVRRISNSPWEGAPEDDFSSDDFSGDAEPRQFTIRTGFARFPGLNDIPGDDLSSDDEPRPLTIHTGLAISSDLNSALERDDEESNRSTSNDSKAEVSDTEHRTSDDSGYAPPHRLPQYTGKTKVAPQKLWAVRVGWIPGIFDNYEAAKAQIFRYPLNEIKKFESAEAAAEWLSQESRHVIQDRETRPKNHHLIGRDSWTRYLQRTWDKENAVQDVNEKEEMLPKLKYLFQDAIQAAESGIEVNWDAQPLPQHLILEDKSYLNQSRPPSTGTGLAIAALRPAVTAAMNNSQNLSLDSSSEICNCGGISHAEAQKEVRCANPDCKIGRYHAGCVGLAKRDPSPTWTCWVCRPPPPSRIPGGLAAVGPTEPILSAQQRAVVDLIVHGRKNICYTGSAGTGKSTVLKAAVQELRQHGKRVDIVAPTGIAALAVNGQTIWRYAGWIPDLFKMSLNSLIERAQGETIRKRLCKTDVLIIEEISMVDSHLFERLERSCRAAADAARWDHDIVKSSARVYRPDLAFGGMQVIVTGDFYQLPPVKPFKFCLYCGGNELPGWKKSRGGLLTCPRCDRRYADEDKWAFRCPAWDLCDFTCVELTEIFRQNDRVFVDILEKCRLGIPLSEQDVETLLDHPCNTINAVQLRPTTAEVQEINRAEFNELSGLVRSYECYDMFHWNEKLHPELSSLRFRKTEGRYAGRDDGPLLELENHRLEEYLQLKVDTLVILLANLDLHAGLANGAQGKVVGFRPFSPDGGKFPESEPSSFLPSAAGEYSGIRQDQVERWAKRGKLKEWPLVRFNNGVTRIIYPQCQVSALGSEGPYSLIGRTQIPLLPAWAITVHKSQGMTLTSVEVDLTNSFAREMIYVALSRCKSLAGLRVWALPADMGNGPNLAVREFLKGFKSAATLAGDLQKTPVDVPNGRDSKSLTILA